MVAIAQGCTFFGLLGRSEGPVARRQGDIEIRQMLGVKRVGERESLVGADPFIEDSDVCGRYEGNASVDWRSQDAAPLSCGDKVCTGNGADIRKEHTMPDRFACSCRNVV